MTAGLYVDGSRPVSRNGEGNNAAGGFCAEHGVAFLRDVGYNVKRFIPHRAGRFATGAGDGTRAVSTWVG